MTKTETSVTLVEVYCVIFYNDIGKLVPDYYLNMDDAIKEDDGDSTPFIIETFEGSNIHIVALDHSND